MGIRRNSLKVYLPFFFLVEFLWRMFPLLRDNRLYANFSTGLKKWLLRVRDILFVFFYPEYLALVPSVTNPVQQLIFLLSISADGKESPLPFWGPSQSFGFYLLPSRVRRPEWVHQVQTSGLHCDQHSFLTVIPWRLATVNSNTRIVVTYVYLLSGTPRDSSENTIKAILVNNTNANTGWESGMVAILEKKMFFKF